MERNKARKRIRAKDREKEGTKSSKPTPSHPPQGQGTGMRTPHQEGRGDAR
jgi:hypothetical protein